MGIACSKRSQRGAAKLGQDVASVPACGTVLQDMGNTRKAAENDPGEDAATTCSTRSPSPAPSSKLSSLHGAGKETSAGPAQESLLDQLRRIGLPRVYDGVVQSTWTEDKPWGPQLQTRGFMYTLSIETDLRFRVTKTIFGSGEELFEVTGKIKNTFAFNSVRTFKRKSAEEDEIIWLEDLDVDMEETKYNGLVPRLTDRALQRGVQACNRKGAVWNGIDEQSRLLLRFNLEKTATAEVEAAQKRAEKTGTFYCNVGEKCLTDQSELLNLRRRRAGSRHRTSRCAA